MAAAAAWLLAIVPAAHAEFEISLFTGVNINQDTDLEYEAPGGTDLTFEDVRYDADPVEDPVFFGGRLTYWFTEKAPQFGLGIEFVHMKMTARTEDTVQVTGTRGGSPVDAREPISDTISAFEMTDGVNLVLFEGFYRFNAEGQWDGLFSRIQPYVGIGLGFSVPHPESTIDGVRSEGYEFAGFATQAIAGTKVFVYKRRVSLFAEYRFTFLDLNVSAAGGGEFELQPILHVFAFGVNVHF